MKKIDLHIHTISTVSDYPFESSIDVLQRYVQCEQLDAIAITNHNMFDLQQYEQICQNLSIPVFPGIEIDLEQGHLLLITAKEDIPDFIHRCDKIRELNSTSTSWINEKTFLAEFPDLEKYVLIPHHDKKPNLALQRVPTVRKYITCGEVTSVKKFLTMKKRTEELVPVLFSDGRMRAGVDSFSGRQTFIDIEELSIKALKQALRDHAKVALSEDDGNTVFEVLDNGLMISSGLTVLLGGRSSGKSYTLDAISEKFDHVEYIRQFELLARNAEADQKRFDDLLRRKGDSIAQEFLKSFKHVVDDVQHIDLRADEKEIERYLKNLKKSATEVERRDAFSKARLFSEVSYDIKELTTLENLISAVDLLLTNMEYRLIINANIDRKSLLRLAVSLRKEYIREKCLISEQNYVNDIVSSIKEELSIRTTNTTVPEIDFYRILLNQRKVEAFCAIAKNIRQRRIIEQKSVYSFRIVASARAIKGPKELHDIVKTSEALADIYQNYQNPYEYLCALRKKDSIQSSEYYKLFAFIDYEVLNKYGTKASGGERSEYNLLERLRDALQEDILLLDEPESSFDNLFLKKDVDSLLKDLSAQIPVVIATHNNTIGASVNPDYLIFTQKEVTDSGEIKYHVYSGYPTSSELVDLEGNTLKRRDVMLNCLEAGEQAYRERSSTYEISLY